MRKHTEMGQGSYTGLCTIVAEELDADWAQVRAEGAPANAALYNNLAKGRRARAAARRLPTRGTASPGGSGGAGMLVAAAAAEWKVPAAAITVSKAWWRTRAGQEGDLARWPRRRRVSQCRWRRIWKFKDPAVRPHRQAGKSRRFAGQDQWLGGVHAGSELPGMLTAVVAHAPRFGGKRSRRSTAARQRVPGVVAVVGIPSWRGGRREKTSGRRRRAAMR